MMKRLLTGILFVLFVGCLVLPNDRSYAQGYQPIPRKDWKHPNWVHQYQPCPDGQCGFAINPHDKNTDFICQVCQPVPQEEVSICPEGMVEIEGYYCPTVKQ